MSKLLRNKGFVLLAVLYFFFCITINLVHPITTIYVNSLSLPSSYFGFFYAAMALGQVAGSFFWGFLSDKVGRKVPLIIGIVGYVVFQALFGFVNSIPLLIIAFRFFSGFFVSAPIVLFLSLTLDKVEIEERTNALSIMTGVNLLGAAIAYEIGGALYDYAKLGIPGIFIVQIAVGLMVAALCLFIKKDAVNETEQKERKRISFKGISPLIVVLLVGVFLMNVGQINVNKYLDVLVIDRGYSASNLGHFVLVTGLVAFATNMFIVPLIKKAKRLPEILLIVVFLVLSAVVVYVEFSVETDLLVLLYTVHMVFIISKSIILPLEQSFISRFSNEKTKGSVMGIRQMFVSLASVAGPLLGSAIYQKGNSLIMTVSSGFILVSALVIFPLLFLGKKKD